MTQRIMKTFIVMLDAVLGYHIVLSSKTFDALTVFLSSHCFLALCVYFGFVSDKQEKILFSVMILPFTLTLIFSIAIQEGE